MAEQSYRSHTRWVPLYHFVLSPLLLLGLGGAVVNLSRAWHDPATRYGASLILVLFVGLALTALFARTFALRAQDRAIRAEEQLRHYVLTGRLLDPGLTMRQVVALRFASDAEFVALAEEARRANLSNDEIKQRVRTWRQDLTRV